MALDDYIGERVIVQGNDSSAWAGTLKGTHVMVRHLSPLVANDEGEEFITMGVILPYHEEVLQMLQRVEPIKAWRYCAKISQLMGAVHRARNTEA